MNTLNWFGINCLERIMLRRFRISAILLFAILIGIAVGRLQEQYKEGILWDQYNGQRKSDVTLLMVSVMSVAALVVFEKVHSKRHLKQRRFGVVTVDEESPAENVGSDSIYSAPEVLDQWQGRRVCAQVKPRRIFRINGFWIGLLRIYCVVLPLVYLYTMVDYVIRWLPTGAGHLVWTIFFPVFLLLSALTSVGFFRKKSWGMNCGYAVAIFHLLIFPIGTIAGLLLLAGLVGAAPEFTRSARKHRREMRKRLKSAAA